VSGPLRDRMDMTVEVPAAPPDALYQMPPGESSAAVGARVRAARQRQRLRYAGSTVRTNSELTAGQLARHCALAPDAVRLLIQAAQRLNLTMRGYDRARRVARTIADLAGDEAVHADHVAESLQFRALACAEAVAGRLGCQ